MDRLYSPACFPGNQSIRSEVQIPACRPSGQQSDPAAFPFREDPALRCSAPSRYGGFEVMLDIEMIADDFDQVGHVHNL